MGPSEAWIALLAALAGGSILKVVEYFLTRAERKSKAEQTIRDEYRLEIKEEREMRLQAEKDVVLWKDKYYELLSRRSGESNSKE